MNVATVDSPKDSNLELERLSAPDRIRWLLQQHPGHTVLSTSFGVQSAVLLHMVTQVEPELPIIFVDTGYLFPETYRFADRLTRELKLNLFVYNPLTTAARQEALHGKRWEQGDRGLASYNLENKVEPMNRALTDFQARAWISGLRRSQSSTRADRAFIEPQKKITKLYPILDWSDRDVYQYLTSYDLPYHPLWEQGYVSVGDVHSTSKLLEGMTAEQTRFNGLKRECGLHEISEKSDFVI
ncbi:MAG: phosphoadenylyl-sulfate reductase [Puniceicoccaceae bacterium]